MALLRLLLLSLLSRVLGNTVPLNSLNWSSYSEHGHLNIGAVFPINTYDTKQRLCSESLLGTLQTQFVEAFVFGIKEVNKRNDILPNITLGFVILDDCTNDRVSLARAMSFIPRKTHDYHTCTVYHNNNTNNSAKEELLAENTDSIPHHEVVAVLGAMRSQNSELMAEVLGLFQVRKLLIIKF